MKKLVCALSILLMSFVAAPSFAQKQGGTLTGPIITTTFVKNLNPFTQHTNQNRNPAPGFIYEPLVVYDFRNNSIHYRVAESFEYSDDLMSITYKIRKGLKWSDGETLDANDVAFSFNLIKEHAGLDVVSGLFLEAAPKLKSVEKIDDNTVRFHLVKVDTTIDWYIGLMYTVPEHIWSKIEDPVKFTNPEPVGNGPFTTVKRFTPQQMTLCRNPNYWEAGKPYLDCVKFRQFQGNDQVQAALIRGEIDWGANFIADIEKTFVKRDPKNNHFWYPAGSPVAIHLNTAKKPFDDLAFRQAFSVALDRPQIVDLATYGYASVNPHITGLGNVFKAWYNDDINKKYDWLNEYDPEKAKKMLDDAGYKDVDGDGFRENKDGSPLNFSIMVVNGWTDWVQSVQMSVEFLKEVGIKAKTKTVEWGQYVELWRTQGFEAGILWGNTGVTPYRFYEPLLHTRQVGVDFAANHGFNSSELDQLIDSYTKTADTTERRAIIDQLQETIASNLPIIPLFSNPTWYQYSTKRIAGWPTEDNFYINPNFYEAGERVIMINHLYQK